MSEKIIFATGNAGKLKEIREILKDLNREIVTMREAGFEGEIEENGTTFAENAAIKAMAVMQASGLPGVSCPLSASSLRATGMLAALVLPWRSMFL